MSGNYAIKKKKGSLKPDSFRHLANVDEVYPCFLAFGLLTSESSKGSIGVNSHTSLLNRFLQTGTSGRITRTAGAYAGAAAKPVSFALVGNAHPSTVLAMLDGTSGHQVAAAHDRFIFYTSPRVVPHEAVPSSVAVRGTRHMWTPSPDELAEIAGLANAVHDPERAVLAGRSLGSDIYTSLDVKIGALAKSYFDGILEIRGLGLFYGHA